jgi:hypothetical protein
MNMRWFLAALLSVASPVGSAEVRAQASDASSEIRKAAELLVDSVELESFRGEAWVKVKRIDQPLLRFSDETRADDQGSLWAWGDKGRPVALFEIFQKATTRHVWTTGICNTSGGKLRASRTGAPWWLENDSDIAFKEVPAAPLVAADTALRQRQMKLLAQKFSAHEIYNPNNTRYDLRRLDRPLRSYRDEDAGIVEGGLFAFANGTNPEILLFVEARQGMPKGSKPTWQFGVGRSANAELHLEYDGREVYSAPRGNYVSGRDKPFWTTTLQFTPPSGDRPGGN